MKTFKELRETQHAIVNLSHLLTRPTNPNKRAKQPKKQSKKQSVNWYPDGSNNLHDSVEVHESIEKNSKLEAKKFELTHHVTNTIPNAENIAKLYDMVHKIQKLGGSADAEYDKIANNPLVPQPYRNCCSCD